MSKNSTADFRASCVQLLVAALIFISASPLFETFEKLLGSTIVLSTIYLISPVKFNLGKKNIIIICVFLFVLIIYGSVLDIYSAGYISYQGVGFFLLILIGLLTACKVTRSNFFLANEKLVYISLVTGLPIYLLMQVYPGIANYAFNYSYGGFDHKSFLILTLLVLDSNYVDRFVGFGSEPGLTQIFYLLALFSELTKCDGKINNKSLIILAAIFLSKSTFGMFVTLVILYKMIPVKTVFVYSIVSIPFLFNILLDELNYQFTYKLVGSESFSGRYDRYIDFFDGNMFNILFGYGNSYYDRIISASGIGGWDSFLQVSQRYGLLFVSFLFSMIYINNPKNQILVFLIIFLSFFSQSIWVMPVIAYFYFNGVVAYKIGGRVHG